MKRGALWFTFLVCTLFLFSCEKTRAQNVWDGSVDTSWYNDTNKEFTITTASQLAGLAKMVNEGNSFSDKTIKLGADIVLNDTRGWENWKTSAPKNVWTPIGNKTGIKFDATFDGQNHRISGVYVKAERVAGLFGNLDFGGRVLNFGVSESYVKGGMFVGGIAGDNSGHVINCYYQGMVEGYSGVGGIVGKNIGRMGGGVSRCHFSGTVIGKGSSIGGIVGLNTANGSIYKCHNSGTVSGNETVGGIVGMNDLKSSVEKCYNVGQIKANEIFGSIAGENRVVMEIFVENGKMEGIVENCYYAEDTAPVGIGKGSGEAIARKVEDFENGVVQSLMDKKDSE